MEYQCSIKLKGKKQCWTGKLQVLDHNERTCEAVIQGHGSGFHVIIGSQINGHFIFILDQGIGSELAGLCDLPWNLERLYSILPVIDAATIAYGLTHVIEACAEMCPGDI